MAFISYRKPDEIPPEHRVADNDNIVRIHGVHAETIHLHYALYLELMRGTGPLTRVQREMIAVTVSATSECRYCVAHHGVWLRTLLRRSGMDKDEVTALVSVLAHDYREAILATSDRAMLDYAVKLARSPGAIVQDDVERLRQAGFDDRAIHDICAIAAYFGFVNRMALGLGVELESRFTI